MLSVGTLFAFESNFESRQDDEQCDPSPVAVLFYVGSLECEKTRGNCDRFIEGV